MKLKPRHPDAQDPSTSTPPARVDEANRKPPRNYWERWRALHLELGGEFTVVFSEPTAWARAADYWWMGASPLSAASATVVECKLLRELAAAHGG